MSELEDKRMGYDGPIFDVHTHLMLGDTPLFGNKPHCAENYLDEVAGLNVRHVLALVIAPFSNLTKPGHRMMM